MTDQVKKSIQQSDDNLLLLLRAQRTKDYCDLLIDQCNIWLPQRDENDLSDSLLGDIKHQFTQVKRVFHSSVKNIFKTAQ